MTEDQEQLLDEIKRHVDVTAESLRGEIRLVAEGVLTVDQKLERFRSEVNTRFDKVDARLDALEHSQELRSSHNGHDTN